MTDAFAPCTLTEPMALHCAYTAEFMPAFAGATAWSKGAARVSLTATLINGQQPRGY